MPLKRRGTLRCDCWSTLWDPFERHRHSSCRTCWGSLFRKEFAVTCRERFILHFRGNYLLTKWCSVLLRKLRIAELAKKYPFFYGNGWFITMDTKRQLMARSPTQIKDVLSFQLTSFTIHCNAVHNLVLGFPSDFFPSRFLTEFLCAMNIKHVTFICPNYSPWFKHFNDMCLKHKLWSCLLQDVFQPATPYTLQISKYFPEHHNKLHFLRNTFPHSTVSELLSIYLQ